MRIARDGEAWRASVWRRRGGNAHAVEVPGTWHPPKPGAEHSASARDRLGYLQLELGDPGLGTTYDLMVACARTAPGHYDWVRVPDGAPRDAVRLFPEGGASFYEAVLGKHDDFVEALNGGDRWVEPLSTWRPAADDDEAVALDPVEALLLDARKMRGRNFDALGPPQGVRALRVVSLRPERPHPLAKFVHLEALCVDTVPLPQALVAIIAALPRLTALQIDSQRASLAEARSGFATLEVLRLPQLDLALDALGPMLSRLPRLHTLRLPDAQLAALPAFVGQLPHLRRLDVCGAPIPDAGLAALRQARPDLTLETSPVSLGWAPGVPGVLRVADGFPAPDATIDLGGNEVRIAGRQVTLVQRSRVPMGDPWETEETVHAPVAIEAFVRQGPPVALRPYDRLRLRRQLEAGLTNRR